MEYSHLGNTGMFHLGAAMNTGLTEAQLKDFIAVIETRVGKREAEIASRILQKVYDFWAAPRQEAYTSP